MISLESWIYPALDKLAGFGLIDSSLNGMRPFSRLEAARLVEEAAIKIETAKRPTVTLLPSDEDVPNAAGEILSRLQTEFRFELGRESGGDSSYFKPIRNLTIGYVYQDEQYPPINNGDPIVSIMPNNNGISYEKGSSFQMSFQTELRLGDFLLLEATPLILEQNGGEESTVTDLLTATAALQLGEFALSFGKQSLWWGQGYSGSLLLTDNAEPLTMVRLTNPSPVLLPWFLERLGPFRLDIFASRLETDRTISEPYFGGIKVDFLPIPWLELGISSTTILGGDNGPDFDCQDVFTALTSSSNAATDNVSSWHALDFKLRLPFLLNARIYGEVGSSSSSDRFCRNDAWIAGIYLPIIEPSGRVSLRFEYTDFSDQATLPASYYSDSIYLSGYTYEGNSMGHYAGEMDKAYGAEIETRISADLTLTAQTSHETQGDETSDKKEHTAFGLEAEWWFTETLSIQANYRFDEFDNFSFSSDNQRSYNYLSAGITAHW